MEELWIGLNDLKLQMNFEWSDGSLVSFTHWHPFEPNNFRDSLEDCVTIWGPVRTPSPYHGAPKPILSFLICQWNSNGANLRGPLGGLKELILVKPSEGAWWDLGLLPAALPRLQVASEPTLCEHALQAGLLSASPTQPRVLSPQGMMEL